MNLIIDNFGYWSVILFKFLFCFVLFCFYLLVKLNLLTRWFNESRCSNGTHSYFNDLSKRISFCQRVLLFQSRLISHVFKRVSFIRTSLIFSNESHFYERGSFIQTSLIQPRLIFPSRVSIQRVSFLRMRLIFSIDIQTSLVY